MILQGLEVVYVDFLKIDIEGYVLNAVLNALPGAMETLKKTKYYIVELLDKEIAVHRTLKRPGFKLLDRHSHNYLYRKEI